MPSILPSGVRWEKEDSHNMKITLLLTHTALIEDDRKPTVAVSPPYAGTLTVEGTDYPIAPEGTPTPRITGVIGYVKAY